MDYKKIDNTTLWRHQVSKNKKTREAINLNFFDKLVNRQLKMYIADICAKLRIENLFIAHHSRFCLNATDWLLESSHQAVLHHLLSAVRLKTLHARLTSYLDFTHLDLRKGFRGFMKHVAKLS